MKVKDLLGQNIKEGDFVVNAAAQNRSGVLRLGVVESAGMRLNGYGRTAETVSIKRLNIDYRGKVIKRTYHETDLNQIVVLNAEFIPQDTKLFNELMITRDDIFRKKADE